MASEHKALKAAGIRWDISDLYAGAADPRLEADLQQALQRARQFRQTYHGQLAAGGLPPEAVRLAIMELEEIHARAMRPEIYAFLTFSANTADDAGKTLHARGQEFKARVQNLTLFFELELQQLSTAEFETLLANPGLATYHHYLKGVRLFQPHTLSEKEEQIVNQKDLTGKTALMSFFDEFTSAFTWQLEVDGEVHTLTAEEMRHLLRRPEPGLREQAKRAYDGRYGENAIVFSNVFNAIIKDHALEMETRGYPDPMAPSLLRNRIAPTIVTTMMEVTRAHYHLAQEYYTLKARLLGQPKTRGCDLIAPVVATRRPVPFAEGIRLVLQAFTDFSAELAAHARQMFDHHWIDAEVRPHKRMGAYCHSVLPQHHPYILMSYNDDLDNVYTLAHELGHAVHDLCARRHQSLFNYHPPLVAAETASVFAEMLLTRRLLREVQERELRVAILTGKLEDLFATIHTQNYYTLFELDAHRAVANGRLSATQLCNMWAQRRTEMYGEAVDFLPEQQWYWAAIPHFIHTPFYCYAYTFGALLVLALFRRYEQAGERFVPDYIALLEAGGSQELETLLGSMGIDLRQPAFWQGGFEVIRQLLDELWALV